LYWVAVGVAVPAMLLLLYRFRGSPGPAWKVTWVAVLLAESWALAWPLIAVRPQDYPFAPTESALYLADPARPRGRALDRDVPDREGNTPVGYALPLLLDIESVRGLNALDVHQYKQYLHFISDDNTEAPPHAIVGNFPIKNKALLDLLGVRYLVQPDSLPRPAESGAWKPVWPDPHPRAFCYVAGGIQQLPAYTVYENEGAFPRAFVVHDAAPMPGRAQALAALKATDFRQKVLLEGLAPEAEAGSPGGGFRPATIRDFHPNRVAVAVESEAPGYLVLADVWFPGWAATVDGGPATVYRANYLFRAVKVPAGPSEVVFTFDPPSYRAGKLVSSATLVLVVLVCGAAAVLARRRRAAGPVVPSPGAGTS
jgi:hypothetical protein